MKGAAVLRGGHSSGQFSDRPDQQNQDAARLVSRFESSGRDWLTGTEAGSKSVLDTAFKNTVHHSELRFIKNKTSDVWILVSKDLFTGPIDVEWHKVIDATHEFGPRGFLRASGACPRVGSEVTILVAHWLTDPDDFGQANGPRNKKMADELTRLGHQFGKKRNLVFYGGDNNRTEREPGGILSTSPFTSLATELDNIQNTGHGAIDCMASYNADHRVSGKSWNVLDDSEFPLHTDHYYCEGSWRVLI